MDWWTKELSNCFPLPTVNDVQTCNNLNYGNGKHNELYSNSFLFNDLVFNDLLFNKLPEINYSEETKAISDKYDKKIKGISKSKKYSDTQKDIKIKESITKQNKDINNIGSTTKTIKCRIYPDDKQIKILNTWFNECIKIYDFCVEKYNIDKKYFETMSKFDKVKVFNDIYGDEVKDAPYDMLSDEVGVFFSNLKSCNTNLKNKNIKHFKLTSKDVSGSQSTFIPKTCIKKDGFYLSLLGKMKGMNNIKNVDLTKICDSRLLIDKSKEKNEYYLCIPYFEKSKVNKNKMRIVALDPGEKVFQSYFSEFGYGQIGINMRNKILAIEKKIRRYQRILSQKRNDNKLVDGKSLREHKKTRIIAKYNKKGKKFVERSLRKNSILKNKRHIKNKIRKCYGKIKNMVKELHNKTALYLVKNYERILLPKFETQNMLRKKKFNKEYFNKVEAEKGEEECKKEIKRVYKQRRLNGRVKFVLNSLSHYKFKMHLSNKCREYGSELTEVTEEYTSKTCTNCGIQSENYNNRQKSCKCGYKINRDINGARNILIKNIKKVVIPRVTK
jgi:putative transposase